MENYLFFGNDSTDKMRSAEWARIRAYFLSFLFCDYLFKLLLIGDSGPRIVFRFAVYSQVAYEIMVKKSADMKQGVFSKRNLILRLLHCTICLLLKEHVICMVVGI